MRVGEPVQVGRRLRLGVRVGGSRGVATVVSCTLSAPYGTPLSHLADPEQGRRLVVRDEPQIVPAGLGPWPAQENRGTASAAMGKDEGNQNRCVCVHKKNFSQESESVWNGPFFAATGEAVGRTCTIRSNQRAV